MTRKINCHESLIVNILCHGTEAALSLEDRKSAQYETLSAAIEAPNIVSHVPVYGAKEDVPWLTCSYGAPADSSAYTVVALLANLNVGLRNVGLRVECRNQIDKPAKRHFCFLCGGYYCASHADPITHGCTAIVDHA
ncbi:hypothetical protein CCAX7_60150 [Capsulimonas corticalis]|uniref:Uncharacterized protein n=1 Tax=Capsulimonas corticalis TaxID=2219043 RepID=A0A9N7QC84_9BACT|nr:hypothetical protein CCAX7_36020 [Capsulimonas corticalis]BDI33964.1 hypothetical protein CCAX7_60150 [Capsulimonas corticalis]